MLERSEACRAYQELDGQKYKCEFTTFPSAELLSDEFSTFFMKEVADIPNNINSDSLHVAGNIATNTDFMFSGDMLQKFLPASADEVKEVTMKSSHTSSDQDPVLTWPLKKFIAEPFFLT